MKALSFMIFRICRVEGHIHSYTARSPPITLIKAIVELALIRGFHPLQT